MVRRAREKGPVVKYSHITETVRSRGIQAHGLRTKLKQKQNPVAEIKNKREHRTPLRRATKKGDPMRK